MSKELIVRAWCPNHGGDTLAVVERTVSLDGGPATVIDLCAECDRKLIDTLTVFIDDGSPVPQPQGPTRRRTGRPLLPLDCPVKDCPIPGYVAPSRSALGQHAKTRHDLSLRELDALRSST